MRETPFTLQERYWLGHYGRSHTIVVPYRRRQLELYSGHGTHDEVDVFVDGSDAWVLVRNLAIGYVGMSYYFLGDEPVVRETLYHDEVKVIEPSSQVFFEDYKWDDVFGDADAVDAMDADQLVAALDPYLG